jgi:small subunit ribosomal protein S4e
VRQSISGDELKKILMQRLVKVDGKVRTDTNFPAGFSGEYHENSALDPF